jgi:LacI family transcriptional regulator
MAHKDSTSLANVLNHTALDPNGCGMIPGPVVDTGRNHPVLFSGRTKRQVLLVLQPRDAECADVLRGISHHLRTNQSWHWSIYLDSEAGAARDPGWLRSRKWHGVISCRTTESLAEACGELCLPLVDLHDSVSGPPRPRIQPDNIAVGHLGAEHFLERDFKNFGFCGFGGFTPSQERKTGFVEALQLAGRRCAVFETRFPDEWTPAWDERQTAVLAAWLRSLPEEVAVMACNDQRARQLVRAALAAGLEVPQTVAVLGVGNDPVRCEISEPEISSIEVNGFEAGRKAAEWLEHLMNGEELPESVLRIEPLGVIARKSSDVLAKRDANVAKALAYIHAHACQGITVDQVVDQVFASRSQLENKFRRYIGRSPQAEIRHTQVTRIRHLLAETNLTLKEIAEQTGFVHVEYMCVLYKRLTGETPGSYRRNNQGFGRPPAAAMNF